MSVEICRMINIEGFKIVCSVFVNVYARDDDITKYKLGAEQAAASDMDRLTFDGCSTPKGKHQQQQQQQQQR